MRVEAIPRDRAKVMALRTARVSAMRGDETKVAFSACCDGETRSSTIQPKPAFPISGFHAASVKIAHRWGALGIGLSLIKGFDRFGFGGGWAIIHSRASEMAFRIVSSGEKFLFSKIS